MDNTKNLDLESDSNSLTVVENLLSKDQLEAFKINTSPHAQWKGFQANANLFSIWFKLAHKSDTFSISKAIKVSFNSFCNIYLAFFM